MIDLTKEERDLIHQQLEVRKIDLKKIIKSLDVEYEPKEWEKAVRIIKLVENISEIQFKMLEG